MKALKVPNNMKDILRWSFTNKFEDADFVSTIKTVNVFDYPLLVNKTVCKVCGHVAQNYSEAEIINAGDCAACDHVLFEVYENRVETEVL